MGQGACPGGRPTCGIAQGVQGVPIPWGHRGRLKCLPRMRNFPHLHLALGEFDTPGPVLLRGHRPPRAPRRDRSACHVQEREPVPVVEEPDAIAEVPSSFGPFGLRAVQEHPGEEEDQAPFSCLLLLVLRLAVLWGRPDLLQRPSEGSPNCSSKEPRHVLKGRHRASQLRYQVQAVQVLPCVRERWSAGW